MYYRGRQITKNLALCTAKYIYLDSIVIVTFTRIKGIYSMRLICRTLTTLVVVGDGGGGGGGGGVVVVVIIIIIIIIINFSFRIYYPGHRTLKNYVSEMK
jgi:hypothetical protein